MDNNENKVDIKPSEIDIDVLNKLGKKCALTAISSEQEMRRVELNNYCEMLSQMKEHEKALGDLLNILTIAGNDKIIEYFKNTRGNLEPAAETNAGDGK